MVHIGEGMEIAKYLKRHARETDKTNFFLLASGAIPIEACKNRFLLANEFPSDVDIPTDEFRAWLKSLGWEEHGL